MFLKILWGYHIWVGKYGDQAAQFTLFLYYSNIMDLILTQLKVQCENQYTAIPRSSHRYITDMPNALNKNVNNSSLYWL